MKTREFKYLLSSFLILLTGLAFNPVSLKSSEGNQIIEVIIIGNRRIETRLIESSISVSKGDVLSSQAVSNDIKSIFKLGYFDDVVAEIDKTEEGIVLIYRLQEKPVVIDIVINGNDEISTEKITEVLTITEGQIVEISNLKNSIESVRKLYSEKGIIPTEVDYTIEPRGEGTIELNIDIKEGKKSFIKKVYFEGNESIKSDDIQDKIYSKPKGFLSFITSRGLYRPEEIDRDSDRIRAIYLDEGYLDVNVSKPEKVYSEEKEGHIITFRIEEGPQYTVGSVDVDGDLIASHEVLVGILKLKQGDIFKSSYVGDDINILTTYYGDRGYAFANVDPRIIPDKSNLEVDASFIIEKGKEVYVRRIDIAGNTRTRDKVIRREIPIEEQSLYNATYISAIKPRIFRRGYFEEDIQVDTQRVEGTDDQVDININVKEKPTGFFSVAGGFSSVETILFTGQIQESNLFGYGKRLSLSAQLGGVTQLFSLSYGDPVFLDSDWNMNARIFLTDREFRDFDRKSFGGALTFGRHIWRNLRGEVGYRFENEEITDVFGDARLIITESDRNISGLSVGVVWDSRNNFLDPTRGLIARTSFEYAGPFGGDTDFIKYRANMKYFHPVWKSTIIALTGRYGYLNLWDVGNDLVVGERFFLGGPNSLRGFKFRRVGPRVPTDDGDFVIIGGSQELLLSAEYIVPLVKQINVKGVLFVDIGNAYNDGEELSFDPDDIRRNVGFGFRWLSPLGPLKLDIGFPLGDRLEDEDSFEIQFTVGNLF
ncbi:MAG: outer membrane protein assembly factor BamA [Candidatus Dadabacteria bacterium]|nr:outer membrane protein assembly factor BamA [Candidatus Dadabacteria bacterium]